MKFNWGHGLTIAIICFMVFIVTLVYKTFDKNADLVRDDYYEQEVMFEVNKQSKENYNLSSYQVQITQEEIGVIISFPDSLKINKGEVKFYRADDKSLDKKYDLKLSDKNQQILSYSDFRVGKYEVNIEWNDEVKTYIYQTDIQFH